MNFGAFALDISQRLAAEDLRGLDVDVCSRQAVYRLKAQTR